MINRCLYLAIVHWVCC